MFTNGAGDRRKHSHQEGQILVLFVGGLIALLLGVALVVDGGNLMAGQRTVQNGRCVSPGRHGRHRAVPDGRQLRDRRDRDVSHLARGSVGPRGLQARSTAQRRPTK